jgi:hypothetical protein
MITAALAEAAIRIFKRLLQLRSEQWLQC